MCHVQWTTTNSRKYHKFDIYEHVFDNINKISLIGLILGKICVFDYFGG